MNNRFNAFSFITWTCNTKTVETVIQDYLLNRHRAKATV